MASGTRDPYAVGSILGNHTTNLASTSDWDVVSSPDAVQPKSGNAREHAQPSDSVTSQVRSPEEERSQSWPALPRKPLLEKLQVFIQKVFRRISRLERARTKVQLLRKELMFARSEYKRIAAYACESQQSFLQHLDTVFSPDDLVTLRTTLHQLYGQCRGDFLTLQGQLDRIQELENTLSDIEFSMLHQENALGRATDKVRANLRDLGPDKRGMEGLFEEVLNSGVNQGASTDVDSDSELDSKSMNAPSSEDNPLLEEYRDTAGNVGIFQDRLLELEDEFIEHETRRAQQEDQGVVLDQSPEHSQQMYEAERQDLERKLAEAVQARDRALHACLANDIDPERHQESKIDDSVESLRNTLAAEADYRDVPIRFSDSQARENIPTGILITNAQSGNDDTGSEEALENPRASEILHWIDSVEEDQLAAWVKEIRVQERQKRPGAANRNSYPSKGNRIFPDNDFGEDLEGRRAYARHFSQADSAHDGLLHRPLLRQQGHSRSSSETRLTTLQQLGLPHEEIIRRLSTDIPRLN